MNNKEAVNAVLETLDEIIVDKLDESENQVECQTLRWMLDRISELIEE